MLFYCGVAPIFFITKGIYGLSAEWTFKLIQNSLKPPESCAYLYKNARNQSHDCFVLCIHMSECRSVSLTNDNCYCSSSLSLCKSLHTDINTIVYSKTRIQVCTKPGYIYFNGICFRRGTTKMTWQEAKLDCELTGGHLMTLDSQIKHDVVVSILRTYYPTPDNGYFVGASDIAEEGNWKWLTEGSSSFMLFTSTNNVDQHYPGLDADCAALIIIRSILIDEYCNQRKLYICEDS